MRIEVGKMPNSKEFIDKAVGMAISERLRKDQDRIKFIRLVNDTLWGGIKRWVIWQFSHRN